MIFEEKAIKTEEIFKGHIINVKKDTVLMPGGNTATREVVEHPGGVCVVADDNGMLIFVRQFRYPLKDAIYELPAGKLSPGEDPKLCGMRELLEETGAVAETFVELGAIYPSPGFLTEKIYIFYASGLTFQNQMLDEDEYLDVKKIPVQKAFQMVKEGIIQDAKTIAGLYHLLMRPNLFET